MYTKLSQTQYTYGHSVKHVEAGKGVSNKYYSTLQDAIISVHSLCLKSETRQMTETSFCCFPNTNFTPDEWAGTTITKGERKKTEKHKMRHYKCKARKCNAERRPV